jgi:anti-sigma factor RsiW
VNVRSVKCSHVRRDLLRQDQLTAVDRGLLEIHLRRCPECHRIAEEFSTIEMSHLPLDEVTEERQRDIYARLVPAVHEITSKPPPPHRPVIGHLGLAVSPRQLLLFGTVALFAMALGFALSNLLTF